MNKKINAVHRVHRVRRQAGISLLELIAGLAIIAMIIIGALALVSQADTSAKSSELLKGVSAIRANVLAASKTGQSALGIGDVTPLLIRGKFVPENWIQSPTTLQHSYGGTARIDAATDHYTLTLQKVPEEGCIRLVAEQAGSSWRQVIVGSTTVTFPTTMVAAAAACVSGDNTLVFYSQLG